MRSQNHIDDTAKQTRKLHLFLAWKKSAKKSLFLDLWVMPVYLCQPKDGKLYLHDCCTS